MGSDLPGRGLWGIFIFLLVYFGFGTEYLWTALLTLLVGGMVAVVLSYPILITLERRFEITPEQALRQTIMVRYRIIGPTSAGCGCS